MLKGRGQRGGAAGQVHDALTEKLEELDQGLNLAEASTRWFREPDQTLGLKVGVLREGRSGMLGK